MFRDKIGRQVECYFWVGSPDHFVKVIARLVYDMHVDRAQNFVQYS